MKNTLAVSYFCDSRRRIKMSVVIIFMMLSVPAFAQKPQLSFFTELPSSELKGLFADSLVIAELKALHAEIRMGVLDFSPERVEVVRQLNAEGIPVVAWLLLPKEEGYWFNMGNGPDALLRYEKMQNWTLENGLKWAGIGIDLEPSIDDIVLMTSDPNAAAKKALGRLFDNSKIKNGKEDYQRVIEKIKSDGYHLESYILPFLLDEREAGSQTFQKVTGILDIPVDTEIQMLYSSFYGPNGVAFIPEYGKGQKAVAIGSTGGGVEIEGMAQTPPTMSWEDLERDLIIASKVVDQVHIFCLESSVEKGYLSKIKDIDYSQATADISTNVEGLRSTRKSVQTVLSILDHPILLSIGILSVLVGIGALIVWLIRRLIRRVTPKHETSNPII